MNFRAASLLLLLFTGLAFQACQGGGTEVPGTLEVPGTSSPAPVPTATLISATEPATLVPGSPTAKLPAPIATAKIVVNVHAGPGVSFPVTARMTKGERRTITGKSVDSKWWQIDLDGNPGWVPADYVDVQGGTNAIPVAALTPPPTATDIPTRVPPLGATDVPATATPKIPAAAGHIYFTIQQADGSLVTAWINPFTRETAGFVALGPAPGDLTLNTNASPLDWSAAANKLAYVFNSGSQDKLMVVDGNGNYGPALASHQAILTPRWTSDGKQIYFIGYDSNYQTQKIYLVNADGSGPRECYPAHGSEQLRGLDVSSRGEIAFVSDASGRKEIWKMDRGCANPVQLTHDNADASAPAYSPDGLKLAYVSNKTGPTDHLIYVIPAEGGSAVQLGPDESFAPVFSPDGNWIAFARNLEVYMMDSTGGNIEPLTPGDRPTWAP